MGPRGSTQAHCECRLYVQLDTAVRRRAQERIEAGLRGGGAGADTETGATGIDKRSGADGRGRARSPHVSRDEGTTPEK